MVKVDAASRRVLRGTEAARRRFHFAGVARRDAQPPALQAIYHARVMNCLQAAAAALVLALAGLGTLRLLAGGPVPPA